MRGQLVHPRIPRAAHRRIPRVQPFTHVGFHRVERSPERMMREMDAVRRCGAHAGKERRDVQGKRRLGKGPVAQRGNARFDLAGGGVACVHSRPALRMAAHVGGRRKSVTIPGSRSAMEKAIRLVRHLTLAIALSLSLCACGDRALPARHIALTECRLPKVAQAVQCGTLDVPENRAHPEGRRLSIFVAVLPANTLSPKPDPLVLLAGGPGQAASTLGPFALQLELRSGARATSCWSTSAAPAARRRSTVRRSRPTSTPNSTSTRCRSRCCARGNSRERASTRRSTRRARGSPTSTPMREALGYRQLNLWGGSYGTRVAQEYLRRHPEHVRSVVLDGVAPPSMRISFDVWRTRDDALDGVIAACRASRAVREGASGSCGDAAARSARALEGGTDGDRARSAHRRLARNAHRIRHDHRRAAAADLRAGSGEPHSGAAGARRARRLRAAARRVARRSSATCPTQFNPALFYSVTCAEDVPRVTRDERIERRRRRARARARAPRDRRLRPVAEGHVSAGILTTR